MPPSPANLHKFRSETDHNFTFTKKATLLFRQNTVSKPDPSSVDYWLPTSYAELMEEDDQVLDPAEQVKQSLDDYARKHQRKVLVW